MALRLFHELYYMAHHENLGSIEERGILSHSLVGLAGVQHVDISVSRIGLTAIAIKRKPPRSGHPGIVLRRRRVLTIYAELWPVSP